MKLEKIRSWLDKTLNVSSFDDVSNNGIQIDRTGGEVTTVAFAVDASVRAVKAAAEAGAQLLVVHHGISWGGGVRRLSGGVGNVVRAAMDANLALYACHLPLDAHPVLGNNAQLAKLLGLTGVKSAFSYHGNVIGLVGKLPNRQRIGIVESSNRRIVESCELSNCRIVRIVESECGVLRGEIDRERSDASAIRGFDDSHDSTILTVGICSGGAGEFAEEAKNLGCDLYLTGEASWGEVIAAENCGMKMICAGHYETEVFGVRAVSEKMRKALKLKTLDLTEKLRGSTL